MFCFSSFFLFFLSHSFCTATLRPPPAAPSPSPPSLTSKYGSHSPDLNWIGRSSVPPTFLDDDEPVSGDALAASAVPQVLRGVVEGWPALRRWADRDTLAEGLGENLNGAERSRTGRFLYSATREGGDRVPGVLSGRALVDELGDGARFSGLLDEHEKLAKDVDMRRFPCQRGVHAAGTQTNIWVSGRATTRLHFDASDNLLFQVVGRKRVLLFPPSDYASLLIHPDQHPSARQAARDLADPPRPDELMRAQAVDLEPGDALYIPPFWFHEVEALDPVTVSVNRWCPTPTALALAEAFREGNKDGNLLPIDQDWMPQQRVIGLKIFLSALIKRVFGGRDTGFLTKFMASRFDHLRDQPALDEDSAYAYHLCNSKSLAPLRKHLKKQMMPLFAPALGRLADVVKDSDLPHSAKELVLGQIVELLAYSITKFESHQFFKHCLAAVPVQDQAVVRRMLERGEEAEQPPPEDNHEQQAPQVLPKVMINSDGSVSQGGNIIAQPGGGQPGVSKQGKPANKKKSEAVRRLREKEL